MIAQATRLNMAPCPHGRGVVPPHARLLQTQAVTLLEIMVVLVILALMASGVVTGLRAVNKSDLRSACSKIVAASRFSYSRAVTQGNTVRMLFDFQKGTMAVEETDIAVALTNPESESEDDEATDVVDPWAAAEARLSGTFKTEGHTSPFSAVSGRDGEPRDKYKAEELADGISIRKLITPHEPEARTDGQGAIYFFPGGIGERAIVQLAQGDTVYTVAIHPLTGAARVYNYAYEPEDLSASDLDGE